jgi:hypothetical protein
VEASRSGRIVDAIARQPPGALLPRVCGAAADVLKTPGVAVAVVAGPVLHTLESTPDALVAESLQLRLGEGPCYDAHLTGWPVLVNDLARETRWPLFVPDALTGGLAGAFSFPLRTGAARFGVFSLYRPTPGALTDDQHHDALLFATLVTGLLGIVGRDGANPQLELILAGGGADTWEVHQATGMVAAQLGLPTVDAWAALRAHAYAAERPLADVAADIVARRLRLDDTGDLSDDRR